MNGFRVKTLKTNIENLRNELYININAYGLLDSRTISKSQELDQLIVSLQFINIMKLKDKA